MPQETINQRLNFLIENLGLSIRAFSATLGVSDTNTRNYLTKGTKPNSDYLESVLRHFSRINPTWLLLGEGEPFKEGSTPTQNQTNISGKKNNVAVANGKNGTATTNNYTLADCEKERDGLRTQLEHAQREIELLTGQLQMQKTIIEGKDQMLDLLRGGYN
jgi:hypothetical protein